MIEIPHKLNVDPRGSMLSASMQTLMTAEAEIAGQSGIEHRREGMVLDVDISVLDGTLNRSTKMIL